MNESLSASADGRHAIVVERRLSHPPEAVWRALTRAEDLRAWFPWNVEMEARPDGKLRFTYADSSLPETSGVITEFDPPRLLVFTWGDDELRFQVRPDGDGSVLALRHTFADRPGGASFAAGWNHCFDAMDSHLTGAPVPPSPPWDVLHERFVAAFGLADGAATDSPDGWEVRFERQLTRPVPDVWAALTASCRTPPTVGDHVPEPFTIPAAPAGRIAETDGATELAYPACAGTVSWRLRDGNGGARLVVAQTGPAADRSARDAALTGWRDRIEALSAELLAGAGAGTG
jgi:uncharacterized protein YndB with AHSA1/START domain